MIVVRVELWSAVTGDVQEIARMTIDNVGGTRQLGDYRTRTMRGRSAEQLHRAMLTNSLTREGRVERHHRLREHVWNLVAKALTGMGYGAKTEAQKTLDMFDGGRPGDKGAGMVAADGPAPDSREQRGEVE